MDSDRPSKILIIEDNAIDREVYKRCLWEPPHCEFEFAEADSAAEGIEMADAWRPDCALIDVNLPDMDGIEALSRLKANAGRMPFAAVVLTAYSEEAVAVRAMKAGAMDYLAKRLVTPDTLPHIVKNAIERFVMQQQIEEQRAALENSGRRCQVLLEAIPQMVWTANAEAQVEYANSRWLEYTGLSLPDAKLEWDRLVDPEDSERTRTAWKQAVESGSVFEIEHRLRRAADGAYRWHLVRAVPMRGGNEDIARWFGTCTDIESHRRLSDARLEEQKLESLSRLAGGLAHDLNNLLMAIVGGASQVMERLAPADPAQDALQGVVQAGESAAELIRRMVAYVGKGNLRVAQADVHQLVREAIDRAGIPENIRLEFHSAYRLPTLETDSELLRQALVDLLRNAVEAIGEKASGSIAVRTAVVELGKSNAHSGSGPAAAGPGNYVAVDVQDTGCGMDTETQKKIFDPFFTTKFLGRGLGLAAVQGFARKSGGGVQVDSAPGKGATFRLLLPVAHHNPRAFRSC